MNAKSFVAIAVAALLGGAVGYLAQKQKTDELQTQVADTQAQLEKARADAQSIAQSQAAREQELESLRSAKVDLARSRNEIAQLQQQRVAAAKVPTPPSSTPAKPAAPSAFPPGTYVSKEQLAFAGFATPEATIQSLAWATMNGQTNFAQRIIPADLPQGQELATNLGAALQASVPYFQGMQVMAEKVLADDRMEIMVKVDSQAPPAGQEVKLPPPFNILPMVKVNNEWLLGGSPQDYTQDWAKTGQVKTYGQ